MRAFLKHFSLEFKTGIRDRSLLLMNYLFPLIFFFMMGTLMNKVNPLFHITIIPSMIIFSILSSAILGMPNPLISAREAGIFRSYKINGVPAGTILSIPAITVTFHMILVGIVITVVGAMFFDGQLPQNWFWFMITFLAVVFAMTGLGLLIGVFASNSRSSILWSQLIFLPSMILGGLMMPSSILPESLKRFGGLLPSTYAMNAFNELGLNNLYSSSGLWSLAILLFGGIVAFGISIYLFRWDNQNISRKKKPILAILAIVPYLVGEILLK